tara:strand:- start:197 stop:388 length:192 start_codon:yes stop_codon:yes gene_type:complete
MEELKNEIAEINKQVDELGEHDPFWRKTKEYKKLEKRLRFLKKKEYDDKHISYLIEIGLYRQT